MPDGFHCQTCGEYHAELPMDFGWDQPDAYWTIPEEERAQRCETNRDWCVIDQKEFFIRGCLEIPVVDGDGLFVWGAWCSLSEASFQRTMETWNSPSRQNEEPMFGWFCSEVPGYPDTICLKSLVHLREVGIRPAIQLEPTDHPLAVEQREGITMDRVREIVEGILHG
ncbi:DUF2199 domain-containing protein [Bremerella sp.]|uniref:DUF2199 domain-containing protein n=1 Tax=Bremerella sp. TaxID=2795602 RepID=UPI00391D7BF0